MKRWLVIGAMLLGVGVLTVIQISRSFEPSYQGKRLTQWLANIDTHDNEAEEHAKLAINQIGTNALPALEKIIRSRDGFLRRQYTSLHGKLPSRLQSIFPEPRYHEYLRVRALIATRLLSSTAKDQCLPLFLAAGTDPSLLVRRWSFAMLGEVAPGTQFEREAVEVLLQGLKEGIHYTSSKAAVELGHFPRFADQSIPALIAGLTNSRLSPYCLVALRDLGSFAVPALIRASLESHGTNAAITKALEFLDPDKAPSRQQPSEGKGASP